MKIVVTGALGHIGSRVIRELPAFLKGSEIVMIDDLSTQRYPSLFSLPTEGKYRFIEADVLKIDLNALCKGADVVIHLAAITNAAGSFEIRDKVEYVNYTATRKVAEACIKEGCSMIYISSTSVYGTQSETVDEECSLSDLKPQSPYAETKLKEESLLESLGKTEGLKYIICRFGTIFGISPGMRFHTAVNKFCWQAAIGQPLTVWRTAMQQKRPYLYLEDAVKALIFIIKNNLFDCRVYNVLTTNSTVGEIVEIISTHVQDIAVEYVDSPIMNQLSYHVLDSRFRGKGFKPEGTLADGIAETMKLFSGIINTFKH
ncbi:MAG: NAD-dependent epimerase/dehydratase [Nitrospirota bacterium]